MRWRASSGSPSTPATARAGDALTTAQVFLALAGDATGAAGLRGSPQQRLEAARLVRTGRPRPKSGRRESNPP